MKIRLAASAAALILLLPDAPAVPPAGGVARIIEELSAAAPAPLAEPPPVTLRERLSAVRIPRVEFDRLPAPQAAARLEDLFRANGLLPPAVQFAALSLDDPSLPAATFYGSEPTALEALDLLAQAGRLKYGLSGSLITLMPADYEPQPALITREFDLSPPVARKMAGPDVRELFGTIPFPPGAELRFIPEFHVLLARHTPEALSEIEALLARYHRRAAEERTRQIEIETRFLEVAEGTLKETGFEWSAPDGIRMDDVLIPPGENLFAASLRGTPAALAGTGTDALAALLNGGAGTLTIEKSAGTRLNLLIRALQQSSGANLLSAPKVIARSGETAVIHVGEIRSFPTAFDIALERYAMPALVPLDYEKQSTGVILEVTPELDPDSGLIAMTLDPEIRELAGFDEQHVGTIWFQNADAVIDDFTVYRDTAYAGSGSTATNPVNAYSTALLDFLAGREKARAVNADRLVARTPIFRTRKIRTQVTVEDGGTIVLGGLIKESRERFIDRVPVLGSIPLAGRLFRSEGERSVKKNLLIFVTAAQAGPGGGRAVR